MINVNLIFYSIFNVLLLFNLSTNVIAKNLHFNKSISIQLNHLKLPTAIQLQNRASHHRTLRPDKSAKTQQFLASRTARK